MEGPSAVVVVLVVVFSGCLLAKKRPLLLFGVWWQKPAGENGKQARPRLRHFGSSFLLFSGCRFEPEPDHHHLLPRCDGAGKQNQTFRHTYTYTWKTKGASLWSQ